MCHQNIIFFKNSKILWHINYTQMRLKIIHDMCLYNILMICLRLNWLFCDQSWMLQLSEFVWTLRSPAWVLFNNVLFIDPTERNKIISDQKSLFFTVSLYLPSFFVNTHRTLKTLYCLHCLRISSVQASEGVRASVQL